MPALALSQELQRSRHEVRLTLSEDRDPAAGPYRLDGLDGAGAVGLVPEEVRVLKPRRCHVFGSREALMHEIHLRANTSADFFDVLVQ